MRDDTKAALGYVSFYAGIFLLLIGWFVLRSKWEAEAYTRLTGKPVSTWDAMFLDLRVQEPIQD